MKILVESIEILRETFKELPDNRALKGQIYSIEDIALSAFSLFYFQSGSWLNFQRNMQKKTGRSNAKSLFGIENIASDNHIRDMLDAIEINKLAVIFDKLYEILEKKGTLKEYEYFENTLLVLLDGTYYHSSKKIHCEHCQTREKEDKKGNKYIEYYHSAITPILAHPKSKEVLALLPELISNKDGEKKQDCEINASKRWLEKEHTIAQYYQLTILGDDLYCKTPLIEDIRAKGHNYIFVCKPTSHKKMYEQIEYIENLGEVDTKEVCKRNFKTRKEEIYYYKYLNEVDLTGDKESIKVNWCSVEVKDNKGKTIYRGVFATDYIITDENVEKIIEAGRCRWKIENENNNTLKTGGYNLAHNFGHGKEGLSEFLFTLNILSFFIHTITYKFDKEYKELYELVSNRKTFFSHIFTFTTFFYISDWDSLWHIMLEGYIDGIHLD
jgi:hypothetical protein